MTNQREAGRKAKTKPATKKKPSNKDVASKPVPTRKSARKGTQRNVDETTENLEQVLPRKRAFSPGPPPIATMSNATLQTPVKKLRLTPQPSPNITPPPPMPKITRKQIQADLKMFGLVRCSEILKDPFLDSPSSDEPGNDVVDVGDDSDAEMFASFRKFDATKVQKPKQAGVYSGSLAGSVDGNKSGNEDSSDDDDEDEPEEDEEEEDELESEPALAKSTTQQPKSRGSQKGGSKQSLIFSVPVDDANEEITLKTPISWPDFEFAMANALGVAPKDVRVAYRFSTAPQTGSWTHVRTPAQLNELVKDARDAEEALLASKSKQKKKFTVILKCTGDVSKDGKEKEKKGKGKAKGKVKSRSKKCDETSSDDDEQDDSKPKKLSQAQWIAKITADNTCDEHNHVCLKTVVPHLHLGKADIATWGLLNVAGWPSSTTPPPKLKLDFVKPKPKNSQIALGAASAGPSVGPSLVPYTPTAPPPPHVYGYPYQALPYGYNTPGMSPYMHQGHQGHGHRRTGNVEMPSSDPIDPIEDVKLFPRVEKWLEDLDNGPQGGDGHNFSTFASDFLREKYVRICDIEGLTVLEVVELCSGMAKGTAKKLLECVERDCKVIRKKEKRHAREVQATPRHYY